MGKVNCDIRIGTSGWHYGHWTELFYPPKLPKNKWLEYYAENFDTVELNNTFYQLPKEATVENWHRQAPKHFVYAVKANRYITHIKRLKNTSAELDRFFERMGVLKEKLGPILYQLPPSMHKDLHLLREFTKLLPEKLTGVFEFRHKSWFSEDTYEVLCQSGVAFCIHDMPGLQSPRLVTGDAIYIRFHGPTGKYCGNYSKSALKNWARWIKQHTEKVRSVYAYFNNDIHAYAVHNARQLKEHF